MRAVVLFTFISLSAVTAALAQTTAPPSSPAQGAASAPATPLTLNGCIGRSEANPSQFTFSDVTTEKKSPAYRLSGMDIGKFVGKRVTIMGGLVPSPNVAAQAGTLEPMESSMSGPNGTMTGAVPVQLPEFRVKTVKPLTGPCPQP